MRLSSLELRFSSLKWPAICLCLANAFVQSSLTVRAEFQVWHDSAKSKSVEAEFVKLQDASVSLRRKSDGKVVVVPLDKLDTESQTLAKKLATRPDESVNSDANTQVSDEQPDQEERDAGDSKPQQAKRKPIGFKQLFTLPEQRFCGQLSTNGELLIQGDTLYAVDSGKKLYSAESRENDFNLFFFPDQKRVLIRSENQYVPLRVRDKESGQTREIPGSDRIGAWAISPDGSQLAFARNSRICLIDLANFQEQGEIKRSTWKAISRFGYTNDGKSLFVGVTATKDNLKNVKSDLKDIVRFDPLTKKELPIVPRKNNGYDREVYIHDSELLNWGPSYFILKDRAAVKASIALTTLDELAAAERMCVAIASILNSNKVNVWSVTGDKAIDEDALLCHPLSSPPRDLKSVVMPNGLDSRVVKRPYRLSKLIDNQRQKNYYQRVHEGHTAAVDVANTGEFVVTGDISGGLAVWDPKRGTVFGRTTAHEQGITGIRICDDGSRCVSVAKNGELKVWEIKFE